jgi:hypothetical protein
MGSNFPVTTDFHRFNKNTGSFFKIANGRGKFGGTRLGPLATYLTWLQAGRPNHHDERFSYAHKP